jgi:hypothetical protein
VTLTWSTGSRWAFDFSHSAYLPASTDTPAASGPTMALNRLRSGPSWSSWGGQLSASHRSGLWNASLCTFVAPSTRSHHCRRTLAAPKCRLSCLSRDSPGSSLRRLSPEHPLPKHGPEPALHRASHCHMTDSRCDLAFSHRLAAFLRSSADRLVASCLRPWDSLRFRLPGFRGSRRFRGAPVAIPAACLTPRRIPLIHSRTASPRPVPSWGSAQRPASASLPLRGDRCIHTALAVRPQLLGKRIPTPVAVTLGSPPRSQPGFPTRASAAASDGRPLQGFAPWLSP